MISQRYNRRFVFNTSPAQVQIISLAAPIVVHSVMAYVAVNTNTWWMSFDEPSGSGTINDQNFNPESAGTVLAEYTAMIQANSMSAGVPFQYKYFHNGGFPVRTRMYFALRDAVNAMVAPVTDYIEIDYSYMTNDEKSTGQFAQTELPKKSNFKFE